MKKADESYTKAKDEAVKQGLSARAIYASMWVWFPIRRGDRARNQEMATALSRAKELLSMPVPPGASLDPAKEEACIRAKTR